ncbi:MAG: hypothetical protein M1830_001360 [Pleopsidium flavum]|nr:MAG: hypothetical protein M1830_001360 [Pleopsidium flavum]
MPGICISSSNLFPASSEQLRSARILLLKVTHSPFVAAIWAYESGYRYITGTIARSSPPLQRRPFLASQNSLSRNLSPNTTFRVPALRSERPLVKAPKIHTGTELELPSPTTTADKTDDTITELKQMIEKLSWQVQELNASIARQPKD